MNRNYYRLENLFVRIVIDTITQREIHSIVFAFACTNILKINLNSYH